MKHNPDDLRKRGYLHMNKIIKLSGVRCKEDFHKHSTWLCKWTSLQGGRWYLGGLLPNTMDLHARRYVVIKSFYGLG